MTTPHGADPMWTPIAPIAYTLFVWWFSTGVILYLNGLPRSRHPALMAVATLLLLSLIHI